MAAVVISALPVSAGAPDSGTAGAGVAAADDWAARAGTVHACLGGSVVVATGGGGGGAGGPHAATVSAPTTAMVATRRAEVLDLLSAEMLRRGDVDGHEGEAAVEAEPVAGSRSGDEPSDEPSRARWRPRRRPLSTTSDQRVLTSKEATGRGRQHGIGSGDPDLPPRRRTPVSARIDRADQTVDVGGRTIGYAEYGAGDGPVVVALHGTPACGLGYAVLAPAAEAAGVRVIAPDRPGVRRSDRRPKAMVADHARDLGRLADALGVDRFGVVGWSGGGPYALAAAALLPDRLTGTLAVASMPPTTMPGWRKTLSTGDRAALVLARRTPRLAGRILAAVARRAAKDPAKAAAQLAKELCPNDRIVMAGGPPEELEMRFFTDALLNGPAGAVDDYRTLGRPWGFSLGAITSPVTLWQGDEDTLVDRTVGQHLAAQIPSATLRTFPGEGHLLVRPHADEALAVALGRP